MSDAKNGGADGPVAPGLGAMPQLPTMNAPGAAPSVPAGLTVPHSSLAMPSFMTSQAPATSAGSKGGDGRGSAGTGAKGSADETESRAPARGTGAKTGSGNANGLPQLPTMPGLGQMPSLPGLGPPPPRSGPDPSSLKMPASMGAPPAAAPSSTRPNASGAAAPARAGSAQAKGGSGLQFPRFITAPPVAGDAVIHDAEESMRHDGVADPARDGGPGFGEVSSGSPSPTADEAMTFLVVDDLLATRRLLERAVMAGGHAALLAKDGKEAMEVMQRERVDVVLLDINMPRMGGFEVLKAMQQEGSELKDIPVIMISSEGEEGQLAQSLEAGALGFINKPINRATLVDRVFRLIQQQGPSRRASSTKGSAPATSNVLCIDDMEGIRKMAERTLSNAGFGVVVAASAEQGLTLMKERVGKASQFDVVLLDLVMPGMGGLEMLRLVRTDPSLRPLSDIPIVVLSGADIHGLNDAMEAGAEDVLMKPFSKEVIKARINGILARKRLRKWVQGALRMEHTSGAGASAFVQGEQDSQAMREVYDYLGTGKQKAGVTAAAAAEGHPAWRGAALPSDAYAVADAGQADTPLVHASPAYVKLVGYPREELLGRNCRMLQGPKTDKAAQKRVQHAVQEGVGVGVAIANYRKDGTMFGNCMHLIPLTGPGRRLMGYLSFHYEVDVDQNTGACSDPEPLPADTTARLASFASALAGCKLALVRGKGGPQPRSATSSAERLPPPVPATQENGHPGVDGPDAEDAAGAGDDSPPSPRAAAGAGVSAVAALRAQRAQPTADGEEAASGGEGRETEAAALRARVEELRGELATRAERERNLVGEVEAARKMVTEKDSRTRALEQALVRLSQAHKSLSATAQEHRTQLNRVSEEAYELRVHLTQAWQRIGTLLKEASERNYIPRFHTPPDRARASQAKKGVSVRPAHPGSLPQLPGRSLDRATEEKVKAVRALFQAEGGASMNNGSTILRRLVREVCQLPSYFMAQVYCRALHHAGKGSRFGIGDAAELESESGERDGDDSARASPAHAVPAMPKPVATVATSWYAAAAAAAAAGEKGPDLDEEEVVDFFVDTFGGADKVRRFWNLLVDPARRVIQPRDLRLVVEQLVYFHPDLAELKTDTAARERYLTVATAAIFASVSRNRVMAISISELRASNLVNAFFAADTQSTNKVLPFSASAFKQVSADFDRIRDGDGFVREEQIRASELYDISDGVLHRIFAAAPRCLVSGQAGAMNFEDFVWFNLAEKDRMTDSSIEYWFRVLDIDEDGYLSRFDLQHFFFAKQRQSAGLLTHKPDAHSTAGHTLLGMDDDELGELWGKKCDNLLVQLLDRINPADPDRITVLDIRSSSSGDILYSELISTAGGADTKRKTYII